MDYLHDLYISKSFICIGNSLTTCFKCKYCRLMDEWSKNISYTTMPSDINSIFTKLPVVVNIFYGDPLLQIANTVTILENLEKVRHKGPVVVITKGDFSKFPDRPFDLDLHFAFSTFGLENGPIKYNGVSKDSFELNLHKTFNRRHQYKYSIEFRPIIYNVNDSEESIDYVLNLARYYDLAVGYSGLQGKPYVVKIWQSRGYDLQPYPGYKFGHKKMISLDRLNYIKGRAKELDVPIFSKTSCLISYTHNLDRDYNAHYYRPSEVGCKGCIMEFKCMEAKKNRASLNVSSDLVPFEHELIYKENHTCILKKSGICEFPTADCSKISGGLIKINKPITTADVRVIKWLTGYTVDANFFEAAYLSSEWLKKVKYAT